MDKQQSGGESDSSSTKSASRWFRRSKDHGKSRASSDSGWTYYTFERIDLITLTFCVFHVVGSEVGGSTAKGKKGGGESQQHQQHRKDSTHFESKRANSLDSVSVKESGPNVITLTEQIQDTNLQVLRNKK